MAMMSQSHQVLSDVRMVDGFEVALRRAKAAEQSVTRSPSQQRQRAKGAEYPMCLRSVCQRRA